MKFLLVGVCAVLFLKVTGLSALQCYVCNIIGCEDPFDGSGVPTTACSGSCLKTEANGVSVRSCSDVNSGDDCSDTAFFGVKTSTCTCTSDLCNNAQTITKTTALLSSAVVLLVKLLQTMFI